MIWNKTKRDLQSGHFKLFRAAVPDLPDGRVEHGDAPDFVVHSTTGVLGVEHRQIFHPRPPKSPPLQEIDATRDATMRAARELAELRGTPPLLVNVEFAPRTAIRRVDALALELSELCHRHVPPEGGAVELEASPFGKPDLPPEVFSIRLSRESQLRRHHWMAPEAGMVLEDASEVLQAAIDSKAERYAAYLSRCARCWLLLVADASGPSTFIEIDAQTATHRYDSPFERTYFLNSFLGQSVLLRTAVRT